MEQGVTGVEVDTSIRFRWLGTAGIELVVKGQVLLIDPYFTRIPIWRLVLGRARPNGALILDSVQRADYVLVTHAHFDHVMDVPDLVRGTRAVAFGSPNTCDLLAECGVPRERIQEINVGDDFGLGEYQVRTLLAEHIALPLFSYGPLGCDLTPPLRARDYRMDGYYSFLISVDGQRMLTDPGKCPEHAVAADVLVIYPGMPRSFYELLLPRVRPRIVVPYHWDDFFRPLSLPLCTFWRPPRWSFPQLGRVNLAEFAETIERIAPGTTVVVPELFRSYDLAKLLGSS